MLSVDGRCKTWDARANGYVRSEGVGACMLRADASDTSAATLGGIAVAPDADAMVSDTASFRIVDCPHCGGMLKPDIVYFGESVPKARVDQAYSLVDAADALLVAGSSLTVYSGFRFVRHAAAKGMPVAIINRGPTRGDDLADVKIDNGCSPMLALLADELPALNVDRRTSAKELNAS